jgi:hypothetical protein
MTAVEEDVRLRQRLSMKELYLQAMYPEDLPFTLPELKKRSQREAHHRTKVQTSQSSPSSAVKLRQQHQREEEERQRLQVSRQPAKGKDRQQQRDEEAQGDDCGRHLAFLPVDVRRSQVKAMARVLSRAPSTTYHPSPRACPSSRQA